MDFKPQNTAISRKKISAPLEYLLGRKYFLSKKHHTVLDYGCGRGKDFSWLKKQGYKVVGWDPYWESMNKPGTEEKFDVVLCSYVINVLSKTETREEVIKDVWGYVAPGGFLLLSSRTASEIKSCAKSGKWKKYEDGFLSSEERQTFQKGFTGEELKKLLLLVVEDTKFIEISEKKSEFSYVLVSKAEEKDVQS